MGAEDAADFLIVGAGAAGCVLANRLSADPRRRVLVIEAGPDIVPGAEPEDVRNLFPLSTFNPAYAWPDLKVHWRREADSPAVPFQQGRVVGGGSTIMGMWALRGQPADYDGWAAVGAAGWSWADVLPYFCKIEHDHDFAGPLHGAGGPLPIRRQRRADWSPLARAVHAAVTRGGMVEIADLNADFRDGHGVLPISRYATSRASAGISYFTAAVRARPNLRLLAGRTVTRIVFDGRRAAGVATRGEDGDETVLRAGRTVLAAGAIFTPLLLLRSGFGPADELRAAGVDVVANRPGVGRNLQNHPFFPILAVLKPNGLAPLYDQPPASTYLRWSSGLAGTVPGDCGLYVRSYLAAHALGRRMALLAPVLMQPRARGHVRLGGRAGDPPAIAFRFLEDETDQARLVAACRRAIALFLAPEVAAIGGPPFVLTRAAGLGRWNALGRRNDAIGAAAAALLTLAPPVGEALLRRVGGLSYVAGLDDEGLAELLRDGLIGTNHVAGTCRMGPAGDSTAVAASDGRLHGADGLIVADASLMPTVPSGNTHLPVAMVAEKIADMMLAAGG